MGESSIVLLDYFLSIFDCPRSTTTLYDSVRPPGAHGVTEPWCFSRRRWVDLLPHGRRANGEIVGTIELGPGWLEEVLARISLKEDVAYMDGLVPDDEYRRSDESSRAIGACPSRAPGPP